MTIAHLLIISMTVNLAAICTCAYLAYQQYRLHKKANALHRVAMDTLDACMRHRETEIIIAAEGMTKAHRIGGKDMPVRPTS